MHKFYVEDMNITKFIKGVEEEFEDLQPGFLKPESNLKKNINWDSINALIFIAHINVEYNAEINAQELIQAETVQDLFNMVESKALKNK